MNGLKRLLKKTVNAATNDKLIQGYHYTTTVSNRLPSYTVEVPDGFWCFNVKETDYYNRDRIVAVHYELFNESKRFEFIFTIPKSVVVGLYNGQAKFAEYNPQCLNEFVQQGPFKYLTRIVTNSCFKPFIDKMWIPL